ncbi:MAG: MMPL family transporter, partial [Actinomycetales bacterium]
MTSPQTTAAEPKTQRRRARGAIWLAIGVAIAWLLLSGAAGPLSGRLSEVQSNDNASFLPASAESTLVANEQAKFSQSTSFPILVVVSRTDGGALSPEELGQAAAYAESIPSLPLESGGTVADYLDPGPIIPIPAEDGKAVLISVSLNADRATENLDDGSLVIAGITAAMRSAAADYPDVQINVTGPGGILSDLIKVFGAIDIQLLGATLLVVIIILVFVYRSPFIWVLPIISALLANAMAGAIVYVLAANDIIVLNGQSQGILTVLVIGAATDYALLMIARYREELQHHESHIDALKAAWRGVVEPIVASGATVSIGLLCLLLSELNSNRSLGPVGAVGIVACLAVLLTLLPAFLAIPVVSIPLVALLAPILIWLFLEVFGLEPNIAPFAGAGGALASIAIIFCIVIGILRAVRPHSGPFSRDRIQPGRWVFWPRIPRYGTQMVEGRGLWSRVASLVGKRPRITWVVTGLVLLILAGFTGTLKSDGLTTTEAFTDQNVDSVIGQRVLEQHFSAGLGTPTIIIANAGSEQALMDVVANTPGVAAVAPLTDMPMGAPGGMPMGDEAAPSDAGMPAMGAGEIKVVDGRIQLLVTLQDPADSLAAEETVALLRDEVDTVSG